MSYYKPHKSLREIENDNEINRPLIEKIERHEILENKASKLMRQSLFNPLRKSLSHNINSLESTYVTESYSKNDILRRSFTIPLNVKNNIDNNNNNLSPEINTSLPMDYKHYLYFFLLIIISALNLGIYRKIVNITYENNISNLFLFDNFEIIFEFNLFFWRIQSLAITLIILKLLMKYTSYNNYLNLSWTQVFSITNFKLGFYYTFYSFFLFYSTKFLSLGLCSLINNFGGVFFFTYNFTEENNQNENEHNSEESERNSSSIENIKAFVKIICIFLSSSGFILLFYNFKIHGLIFIFGSFLLNHFYFQKLIKIELANKSIFQTVFNININSFLICLLTLVLSKCLNKNDNEIFYENILFTEKNFVYFIALGLLALMTIAFTLLSPYILNPKYLAMVKYFEMPLNDIFGFLIFETYNIWHLTYVIGFIHILFAIMLSELWRRIILKDKDNKLKLSN